MDNRKTERFSFLNNFFFALSKREIGLHDSRDIGMDEDSQKQFIFLLLSFGAYIKVIWKGMIVFGIEWFDVCQSLFKFQQPNINSNKW